MCHLPVLPYCVFVSAEWWPKKSLWKLQINRKLGILDYSTQDKDTASLPSLQESTAQLSYRKHCEWRKLGSNHWHLFSPCAVMFVPEMCSIHWSECACLFGFETGSWCVTHLGLGCCYLSLLSAEITSTYHCFGGKKKNLRFHLLLAGDDEFLHIITLGLWVNEHTKQKGLP